MPKISQVFNPRANGLNALRLGLALGVIVWHSFPLTGREVTYWPLRQLLGEVFVDAFFAISGFLITMSWVRNPRILSYLRARALRILPAFYVCLFLTAFVFAPLAMRTGHGVASFSDGVSYVVDNAFLRMNQEGVGTTPGGVPVAALWNGSLWTLFWEALCYLMVAMMGLTGLLKWPRATASVLFAGSLAARVVADNDLVQHWLVATGSRFALMFSAGMLVYVFAKHIPLNVHLLVTAAVVVAASALLPDYRTVAAPFLAYLVLGLGALLVHPRWNLHNDLSYGTYIYAFPVQQGLAMAGLWILPVGVFMVLSALLTAPLAAASWFAIEKPSLRLRRLDRRQRVSANTAVAGAGPDRTAQAGMAEPAPAAETGH